MLKYASVAIYIYIYIEGSAFRNNDYVYQIIEPHDWKATKKIQIIDADTVDSNIGASWKEL